MTTSNPGSPEAIALGCTCIDYDNVDRGRIDPRHVYWRQFYYKSGMAFGSTFLIRDDCPIHKTPDMIEASEKETKP